MMLGETTVTLIIGIITAVVSIVGTYATTVVHVRKQLAVEYDKDLRGRRIDVYKELWSQTQPLAKRLGRKAVV